MNTSGLLIFGMVLFCLTAPSTAQTSCQAGFNRRVTVVVVRQMQEHFLQIADLQIFGSQEPQVNIAGSATCYQVPARGTWYNGEANGEMPFINDADASSFSHSGLPVAAGDFAYCVLSSPTEITRLVISPRQGHYDRSQHFRLELFASITTETDPDLGPFRPVDRVWEADVQNGPSAWSNHAVNVEDVQCRDTDECESRPCDPLATCINTPGSFTCACPQGYLANGTLCTDMDECQSNSESCDSHSSCQNTPGSFECVCNPGYGDTQTVHTFNFDGGEDLSMWTNSRVSQIPGAGGFLGRFDSVDLTVSLDLTGLGTDHTELVLEFDFLRLDSWDDEIFAVFVGHLEVFRHVFSHSSNPCAVGNVAPSNIFGSHADHLYRFRISMFHNTDSASIGFLGLLDGQGDDESWGIDNVRVMTHSARAAEYVGVFQILGSCESCSDGIRNQDETAVDSGGVCAFSALGPYNRVHCHEVDECSEGTHNCSPEAVCTDTDGSFTCACNQGLVDWHGDGTVCDVDECQSNSESCDSHSSCQNTPGSFECVCNPGYGDTQTVHTFNFDGGEDLSMWTNSRVSQIPGAGGFLGRFDSVDLAVSLDLTGLGTDHTELVLEFDFLRLDSWDDEIFAVFVGHLEVFRHVFSHSSNPCAVGNVAPSNIFGSHADHLYRFRISMFHNTDSASIGFLGLLDGQGDDESWGIDNVRVMTHSARAAEYVGVFQILGSCESCSDGIRNQDETAVDSGGVCAFSALGPYNRVHCHEVDECSEGTHNCSPEAVCTDTDGSFTCACNQGLVDWFGGTVCDQDQCSVGTNNCHSSALCEDRPDGFECRCHPGYENYTDPSVNNLWACRDIDECSDGTHACDGNATCSNEPGNFSCTCNAGFAPFLDLCQDIDECEQRLHNCHENAACSNAIGSFTCTCEVGYLGEGLVCEDVNECFRTEENVDIAQACRNPATGLFTATCTTAQSSTGAGGTSERALDGDTNGAYFANSCTHTTETAFEWWRVDLHDHLPQNELPSNARTASEVKIWNRQDCCEERLSSFQIFVSNSSSVTELSNSDNLCYTHSGPVQTDSGTPLIAPCHKMGRYLWISLGTGAPLTLCEVQVVQHTVFIPTDICPENSLCENAEGSFSCPCQEGFASGGGGAVACEDVDECSSGSNDCHVNAACSNTVGSFTCGCNVGFIGDGLMCEDVDECVAPNPRSGAVATSSTLSNAGGATDGNFDLILWRDSTAHAEVSTCEDVAHLVIDLGNPPIYLSAVTVWHYFANQRQYCSQSVELSATGTFQGEQVNVFSCGSFADCGDVSSDGRDVTFAPTLARFVRIGSSRNNHNTGVHILEVQHTPSGACSPNATCNNTVGAVSCTCDFGYSGDGATCDQDACITVDGRISCYQDLNRTEPWASAVALCEAEGGHLPVLTSRAESDFLYSLTGRQTWLGLTRDQQSSPDITDYEWVTGESAHVVPNITIEINDGPLGSDCLRITDTLSWGDDCDGQYAVVCQMGSKCETGYRSSGSSCVDNDECALGTDTCDTVVGTCTNTPGSFTCACNVGWELVDGAGCTDALECGHNDNCDPDATCTDGNGSFTCTCRDGTLDWNSDGTLCDVDECASDRSNFCGSNASCVNTAGSFECHCDDWFGTPNKTHFSFDFEGGEDLSTWSQIFVDSTDSTTFLGRFDVNNPNVSLSLTDLLPHTELILDFEFYRLDSWNAEAFSIEVDGKEVFRNTYQSASNDACAIEGGGDLLFAVYHYRISLPHTGGSAVIRFAAGVTQARNDSSWGIDNVNVTFHSAGSEEYVGASMIQGSCETCSDGIQNQNEHGVDSGGVCDPEEHEERRYCFPVTECIEEVHNASCFDYGGDLVRICPILQLCFLDWTQS